MKGEERGYVERKKGDQRVISLSMESALYTSLNCVTAKVAAALPKVVMNLLIQFGGFHPLQLDLLAALSEWHLRNLQWLILMFGDFHPLQWDRLVERLGIPQRPTRPLKGSVID